MIESSVHPLSPSQYALIDIELTIAAHHENIGRRMTIADQLKAARADIAAARQDASNVVAEAADAANLVKQEIAKARKEAADLRAEVAGLTNGGPILDEPLPTPLPPAPQPVGSVEHTSASGVNVPGVTTF